MKKKNNKQGIQLSRSLLDRLAQQKLQKHIKHLAKRIHEQHRRLDERAFYPAHSKRMETPAFRKAHDLLVKKKKLPCIICGATYEILKDRQKRMDPKLNPYGARNLETHHYIIEWALAGAIDKDKFNKRILPHLRHHYPHKTEYKKDFTTKQIKAWVDHSVDNLLVLCDVHHRHKWLGVHMITYPVWSPQTLLKDNFIRAVERELKKHAGNKR